MVRALLLLALLANQPAYAASLTAQLDKPAITLGEPVSLSIQANGLSLDALDITPLLTHFDVFARTLSRGTDSETLVLTLYPRAPGALRVPALQLHSLRTAALPLKVDDGSDSLPRVTTSWSLTPAQPRVNQPSRLTLDMCDDGSLQWQHPLLTTASGRLVRALGEDEGESERAGERCTLHRYHWALHATQSGTATLAVAMLDATRFGQRLRFPGAELTYHADALPAWLPPHVPPVAAQIESAKPVARWPLKRPLSWRFQVTGGYSAEGMKTLLDTQLRDTPALGVYPPLIKEVALDDPASPLTRYDVTLFFQPRASGVLSMPTLRLPWFDVERGHMSSSVLEGPVLTVFDPRWQLVARVAGGLAGLLVLGGLFWKVSRILRWRLARRRGLLAIRQSRDVTGLAQAVRQFSLTGQPAATSLGEWVRRLQHEAQACDLSDAVCQLEQQMFGKASRSLPDLQQGFLRALARISPQSRGLKHRFRV